VEAAPTLSIITPVYNGEKYISECIELVASQNYAAIEHIIVDGESTDRTVPMICEKASTYPHIRWISERDRGQSDAMNKGINMARAQYIGILNVDDFYEPGTLSLVGEMIKDLRGPRFIVGACNILTDGDKVASVNRPSVLKFENIMVDEEVWPFPQNPAAYFYPKVAHNLIGPYNHDEHQVMDFEFILAILQAVEPLYIDAVLGNMRFIEGTKTFESIKHGSLWPEKRRIRAAAWKRAPLKTKLRVASLWVRHRPYRLKVAYWNFHRRRAARLAQRS
jgi:glycosyltransferase involved in cell wall biosynthesis